jgi:hypothetical protein
MFLSSQKDVSYSNQSADTGFTIQTVDKTMKFVTSTIQGVRKWSEYRDQIPLIFEVFGKYDQVYFTKDQQIFHTSSMNTDLCIPSHPGFSTNIKQQWHSKTLQYQG